MWALPGATSAILSAGGGSVVSGPAIQMAEVIQSGVVDGFVGIPPWDAEKFNALQHAQSITVTRHKIFTPAFSFVISDAAWSGISAQDQAAIMALSGAAFDETVGTIWTGLNDTKIESLDAQMQVIPASDAFETELLAASGGPVAGWLQRMKAIGLNGEEVLEFYKTKIAGELTLN
jgi:TRAP-type C4-dicarboxylate transport system substrate-binding protein